MNEEQRLQQATKITDWDGEVCDDAFERGNGEGYFSDVDAYQEDWLEKVVDGGNIEAMEPPSYVWTCKKHFLPRWTSQDIADRLVEDMHESAFSELKGLENLQQALDTFYELNKNVYSISPDYSKAVLLDWSSYLPLEDGEW